MSNKELFDFLAEVENNVNALFANDTVVSKMAPNEVLEGTKSYLLRSAKRLRPALVLMSYGCINHELDIEKIIPIAAGVELFHTWTLTHDDIIDNDEMRRGGPTVHKFAEKYSKEILNLTDKEAKEYGLDVAILVGDLQHALSTDYFVRCAEKNPEKAMVILKLIQLLETDIIGKLVYGEVLDVQFSYACKTFEDLLKLPEDDILEMLWLKTGVLYHYAATVGASLAINASDFSDARVQAMSEFAGKCGIAFQLQDDILGIIGTESVLGKPIGSDIREGKKTTILLEAVRNASEEEKNVLFKIIGNKNATDKDIEVATNLLIQLGGIKYTRELAQKYIQSALPCLDIFDDSPYKRLLLQWADFMYNREF